MMDAPDTQKPPTTLKPDYRGGKNGKSKLKMIRDYVEQESKKRGG
jgi:hypothetical protein